MKMKDAAPGSSSDPQSSGAIGRGLLTSTSLVAVSATAVVAAAILGRHFGRDEATDGFLAAYGVYLVLALAAQSFRLLVIPELTRAQANGELAAEVGRYMATFLLAGLPLCLLVVALGRPVAGLLTGSLPTRAADTAAAALAWLLLGGVLQLLAGLYSSALAATRCYWPPALGYTAGAVTGVGVFVIFIDRGLVALAWGTAVSGGIAAVVPLVVLSRRVDFRHLTLRGVDAGRRLLRLLGGASVPLVAQALYLLCLRATTELPVGTTTSFSYAYLATTAMVAATSGSLALVSSQPFTGAGRTTDQATEHVVRLSWLSLVPIAAGTGVLVVAGGDLFGLVLGGRFGGRVGAELGLLILAMAPWAVAATLYTLLYPLVFVFDRGARLPLLAGIVLSVHVLLLVGVGLIVRGRGGATAVALVLAISTVALAAGLGRLIAPWLPLLVLRGTIAVGLLAGALGVLAFVPWAMLVGGLWGAVGGLVTFVAIVAAWRPAGLKGAVRYARGLT